MGDFKHVVRLMDTNIDGKEKIIFGLSRINGIGRRFANLVCKKGEIDFSKRAGELKKLKQIVNEPQDYKIPCWFLNNKKDFKNGSYSQITRDQIKGLLYETLERLKKIRSHRGRRHQLKYKVRGQHTCRNHHYRPCFNRIKN